MECQSIVAIHLANRTGDAPQVQEVLTDFGGIIRVRLGIHATDRPSDEGLIVLHVCGEPDQSGTLVNALNAMDGVHAQEMRFPS